MAARYWVGGTATWDNTFGTKWALTSGGAGGQSSPTTSDDVFFTNLSTGTCTIGTNFGAKSINCTGFTGTLTGATNLALQGSLTLAAGMTYTYTGEFTIQANSTITSAGKTLGPILFNSAASTLTLGDACTLGATRTFTLLAGTLDLAGFTLSTGIFSSNNTGTRAILFGTNNIALTSTTAGANVLNMATATNFTYTGTGAFTRNMLADATVTFGTTGGTTSNAPNLTFTSSATLTIAAGSYFKNVTFTGFSGIANGSYNACGNLTFGALGTYTAISPTFLASGTITGATRTIGNTVVNGAGITVTTSGALTLNTTSTFTLTAGTLSLGGTLSTGTFSSTNTNTRQIAFGANNIALTSTAAATTVLSMADATNFTYTGTGGFTRVNSATASVFFGSTAGGSTTNAVNFTLSSGGNNFSINGYFKNVFFTATTAIVSGSLNMAGNLTLTTSASFSALNATFLASATFTTVGATQFGAVTVNGAGITVTITSSINNNPLFNGAVTLTEGTLNLNNSMTYTSISSSNTNVRALTLAAGTTPRISGSGANAWNTATSTNLTFTPNTATISMTSASAKTFAGGGLTYYNLNQGGTGALTISGSNTFNNITNTVQPATVTFTAGTTQTVSNFSLSGTAASKITINSSSAGPQFTLSKASGTVTAQNLNIQDSNATGGAGWYASNSTNLGNTTGWNFQSPNMFAFLI